MSQNLPLYRLQNIDTRIRQVTLRLETIEATINNNAELRAAEKNLEEAKITCRRQEKELAFAESESSSLRIKLQTVESNLYSGIIKNPKELQDLQKEITVFKRNLGVLEDQQIELMISLENSNETLEAVQNQYKIIQGKVISENASLNTELISFKKEMENLNAQRQAVIPVIDSSSLSLYDSLRQKRSGLAVSQVIENACNTCGASLTPGLAQSVRTSNQLVTCPMCGRILYSN